MEPPVLRLVNPPLAPRLEPLVTQPEQTPPARPFSFQSGLSRQTRYQALTRSTRRMQRKLEYPLVGPSSDRTPRGIRYYNVLTAAIQSFTPATPRYPALPTPPSLQHRRLS